MSFAQIFFLTVDDEMDARAALSREHCSTAVAAFGRRTVLLHNEDYPPRYDGRLVTVDASPDGAPRFLAVTYPYMLGGVSCVLNAAGLAFGANSLTFPARARRVPANYALRAACAARSLADVRRILSGGHGPYVITVTGVTARDGAFSVEATPHGVSVTRGDRFFAHTNHTLSGAPLERPSRSSLLRLDALARKGNAARSVGELRKLFASRKDGLLRDTEIASGSRTLATALLDLGEGAMYVARRGLRNGAYRRFSF